MVTELVVDPVTGLPTSDTVQVPAGNIYLRQSTPRPDGGQGSLVTATQLLRLHAARQIVGQKDLGIDVSGPGGVVDIAVGTNLTLNAGTTIKADGRVSLASTGGDLTVNGTIQGHSTVFADQVTLAAAGSLSASSSINATNLIGLSAGGPLYANLNLTVTGADGTIDLHSGQPLGLDDATVLKATKRVSLSSDQDIIVGSANIQGVSGAPLAEVSIDAGGNLSVRGGAITASKLIALSAGGALNADLNLTAADADGTIDLHSGQSFILGNSTVLKATKRVELSSDHDIHVSTANIEGVNGAPLSEVSIQAGGNLTLEGGAITVGTLINLGAGRTLNAILI
jgi:hypothetical protein